ncbi:flippase [Elioraea sp.]|uniref:flippase n=1 Tax=Elioraea sp. TaxID=2185103 RepID=UPI003F70655E
MTDPAAARAGTRRLVSGVAWNMLGRGLPLLVALALTPPLVAALGIERWGLFTLALGLVGVFGVFDLGLGAALTRTLAERMGRGEREGEGALVASALALLVVLSGMLAVALWLAVPALVERGLNVPAALQGEAVAGLRVLAAAAPLVVVNAALWGVLAAHQRFRAANLAAMPVAVLYYLGPLLVLLVWDSLAGVMLALVGARVLNTLAYAALIRPIVLGISLRAVSLRAVGPLLRLGGWMSLSGVLTQVSLYADRFLIGALLSLAAVAFYATPLDLVMRLWILPVAVAQALLPALASSFRAMPGETAALLRRGVLLITGLVLPGCVVLVVLAHPLLRLWLGPQFADGGATVLRILSIGILFSCAGFAPGSLLDAIGRPDVTARFVLVLAVVSLPLAVLLLLAAGIEGAAMAWSLRCAVECGGRMLLAARFYPAARAPMRRLAPVLASGGAGIAAAAAMPSVTLAAAVGAVALAVAGALGWRALDAGERTTLAHPRRWLRRAA